VFHFIPRVIRDAIYDLVARNRYRWFGRRDACILPNSDRSWPW
jgi:predicted DCC family thiol-disulfide oxidoreductase YuxK